MILTKIWVLEARKSTSKLESKKKTKTKTKQNNKKSANMDGVSVPLMLLRGEISDVNTLIKTSFEALEMTAKMKGSLRFISRK